MEKSQKSRKLKAIFHSISVEKAEAKNFKQRFHLLNVKSYMHKLKLNHMTFQLTENESCSEVQK